MTLQANDWLDTQHSQMLADLTALCNQNSGSENVTGLLAVAQWLETWAGFSEATFQRVTLTTRTVVTDGGEIASRETGPALRWDYRPNARQRVLLAIHYDTVFGVDHSFQACGPLSDDRLQGPGVADAKGGIVVLRYALRALEQFSLLGDVGWTVLLNPDEELGSPSSTSVLHEIASNFDFGLLFEPALPTGELVSTRKGSGNFDIVVRGKSAHAGRHFHDGRNAVGLLSRLMCELDDLNGQRDGLTINVGYVHGGGAVNIVPDLAVGRFNVRMQDSDSVDWACEQFRKLVDQANSKEGFSVSLHGGITSPPKELTSRSKSLMQAIESVTGDLQFRPVRWTATGGVCDGNKLAAAGLPNIDTLGPIGGGLHSSSEWVQVSSLADKAKVVVHLLHRFANGDFESLSRQR